MAEIHCRHFSGYKPCNKHSACNEACPHRDIPDKRILFIHLGALGAVVRSTAVLSALRQDFPDSHITWLTQAPADQLLKGNPDVDVIVTLSFENLLGLSAQEFDVIYCVDKSSTATAAARFLRAKRRQGFSIDETSGAIVPASSAAEELWSLGLSDHKKFFVNNKSEVQLTLEALEIKSAVRPRYVLTLSEGEKVMARQRRALWCDQGDVVVGLNTGCAPIIPYKKLTITRHRELIDKLQKELACKIVLLGGREDTDRNIEIARGKDVVLSPTEHGLRDGLCSVEACDVVVTGDSLGMHMAIGREKWVVAWFGPTCAQEVDLYDRGERVRAPSPCSPCWKRSCSRSSMCYDEVSLDDLVQGVRRGLQWLKSSSSKPLSLATRSLASP